MIKKLEKPNWTVAEWGVTFELKGCFNSLST